MSKPELLMKSDPFPPPKPGGPMKISKADMMKAIDDLAVYRADRRAKVKAYLEKHR